MTKDSSSHEPLHAAISETERRLARRLRELRHVRRQTLNDLAEATGFTKGYLSKIENSHVVPPIATLIKLSKALDVELNDLLGNTVKPEPATDLCIVRSWEREPVLRGGTTFGYDYQALTKDNNFGTMQPFLLTLPPDIDSDARFEHRGDEFLFVLEGEIEFELTTPHGLRTWLLSKGDSVHFNSALPHRMRGLKATAMALLIICE